MEQVQPSASDNTVSGGTTRPVSYTWMYAIAGALAAAVLGIGIYLVSRGSNDWSMLAAGALGLVAVVVTLPICLAISANRKHLLVTGDTLTEKVTERLDQMSMLMNVMSDQQLLSDRAKQVAYREKDREAIRRAIQEDLGKGDWDAASNLALEMEEEFGYKAEAERVRDEIRNRRQERIRREVAEAVTVIDRHTRAEQWNAALREAEKLMQQFPDSDQVRNLPVEIEARRQNHKRQLLNSWNEAVNRHDTDGSIEILKQLDLYLTPAEAEGMQETARNVFKDRLNNLQKQFSTSVTDRRWAEAIRTGEMIVREYPNTRSAQEVREKLDALRARATEEASGGTGTPAPAAAAS